MRNYPTELQFLQKILLAFLVLTFLKTLATATSEAEMVEEITSRKEMISWAGYGEEKLSTVSIGGKILCKVTTSEKPSKRWVPVSGASVSVFCCSSGVNKKSLAESSTDSTGEFIVDLPSNLHSIPNLEKKCHVKVIHVPKSSHCAEAFSKKSKGIRLDYTGEGVRSYTIGSIHLMPKPSLVDKMRRAGKKQRTISLL